MTQPTPPIQTAPPPGRLREAVPAIYHLTGFNIFNAVSFNIALGAPMILLVRHWGASTTYIGLLTALVPLMMTLQLYMAPRVEYIGYRRLLIVGWSARTVMLMGVAVLPFLSGRVPLPVLLAVLFALMLGFNILRGIATTAYMPWLRTLIDERWRGRYISIEQAVANLSAAATFFLCGLVLGTDPGDERFGYLFIASFAAGWISIVFLTRIDSPPPLEGKPRIEPFLRWAARVWGHRPFRKLILVSVAFSLAMSAWPAFTIVFLRDRLEIAEGMILTLSGINTLGVVASAIVWGLLADRFGSRPVMALATRILAVMLASWLLLTMGVLPASPWLLIPCFSLFGLGFVGFHVANIRYCLNNAPKGYPVLALSLFMFATSLANGLTPIAWGGILDLLKHFEWQARFCVLNKYTVFYGGLMACLLVAKWRIRRLPDEGAGSTRLVLYHMMNDYPLRALNAVYALLRSGSGRGR